MSEPFLAEIRIVSFSFPPKGWALCNGQVLPINQNQALFSLLGTMYGGDGRVTFALPNLRGRTPIHVDAMRSQGTAGGAEAHTLTPAEVPTHNHTVASASTADADSRSATGRHAAVSNIEMYAKEGPLVPMGQMISTAAVGGNQAHTNMQPYLVLNFIIALQGVFPPRD